MLFLANPTLTLQPRSEASLTVGISPKLRCLRLSHGITTDPTHCQNCLKMATDREEAQTHKRPHHTDLRTLATTHESVRLHMSSHVISHGDFTSPASSSSAISLAIPSLAAVRKFYQDNGLRTAFQTELSPTEHMVHFSQNPPRRDSILLPSGLAIRMERIAVSSPANLGGEQVRERRSIVEVSRNMLSDEVNRIELAKLGGVVSRGPSSPHPSILSTISARISSDPPMIDYEHGARLIWKCCRG